MFEVVVSVTGRGRYQGGNYEIERRTFSDEKRARDFYTEMLVKYCDAQVEFIKREVTK